MRLFRTKTALLAAMTVITGLAQNAGDIPKTFTIPDTGYDYVKRVVMIPMRDGVRLHTVILIPKGAKDAPMVLTRTPYNASKRAERNASPTCSRCYRSPMKCW
jgi:predicted acyl esterase